MGASNLFHPVVNFIRGASHDFVDFPIKLYDFEFSYLQDLQNQIPYLIISINHNF